MKVHRFTRVSHIRKGMQRERSKKQNSNAKWLTLEHSRSDLLFLPFPWAAAVMVGGTRDSDLESVFLQRIKNSFHN